MATITRENIGLLNDKIVVKVAKDDYLPSFEKAIKSYSKQANIPGFRKGMVPAGMVKKMYGTSVFADEVIKSVEKGLTDYMTSEKLDIFAQPLPLPENDNGKLDMNNPSEYSFAFEVGLKPEFDLADLGTAAISRYKVTVTDSMVDEAIENIRGGNKKAETTEDEEGAEEKPAEKAALNEAFFQQVFPGKEITNEEDFRKEVKAQIQTQWDSQAHNQIFDQIYHSLLENTRIDFPQDFLKRWMQNGGEQPKTQEEVEKEFPTFVNQLKWTLITDKLVRANNIEVKPEDISNFAKQQLFGYMGGMGGNMEDMLQQPWVKEYVDKMMKDRKFVEDSYHRIQTDKVFEWAETQIKPVEKEITSEEFTKMQEEHQHQH
ncbi:MAG: trigger factor [Chitinophagaceae bacterium]|nr:trigger factor [Chitinophagaceae bacterium]